MQNPDLRDRIAGAVLGTAIGDALGFPIEFLSEQRLFELYPEGVKDFAQLVDGVALYSDDTQMLVATLQGLWRARTWTFVEKAAQEVAEEYIDWMEHAPSRAPGNACMAGCRELARRELPYWKCGVLDAEGCGTAMRSMAYGMWFPDDPGTAAAWAADHAQMTHRSSVAFEAAAIVAGVTAVLVNGGDLLAVMRWLVDRTGDWSWNVRSRVLSAAGRGHLDCPLRDTLRHLPGWRGDDAVAAALFCVMRMNGAFEESVLAAVNHGGDSDSTGAIAGAFAGALCGASRLPERWVNRVEGRYQLLKLAERIADAVAKR